MTTPLKVIPWHHVSRNSINARQQSIDCCLVYWILLSSVLHIAGRGNLPLSIFYNCHMAADYSSTCTNNWLGMVVWCYFKRCCHFNAPYVYIIYRNDSTRWEHPKMKKMTQLWGSGRSAIYSSHTSNGWLVNKNANIIRS